MSEVTGFDCAWCWLESVGRGKEEQRAWSVKLVKAEEGEEGGGCSVDEVGRCEGFDVVSRRESGG
jgi:hypothetical protein